MILNTLSTENKSKIALKRDEAVFKSYFIQNYKVYEKYAFGILKDRFLAEDVASEIMWKMWHLGEDLMHVANVEQYILKSIKNKCLNMMRVRQPLYVENRDLPDYADNSLNPETLMIEAQAVAKIQQAISELPEKTKQAFLLVKEEKMTYKEAAESMNISPKTVDRHIQNAIKKLFSFLKA
jgi:RNA polymerase sigma factor (sigma-70 family)